jgi:hypothetical protein
MYQDFIPIPIPIEIVRVVYGSCLLVFVNVFFLQVYFSIFGGSNTYRCCFAGGQTRAPLALVPCSAGRVPRLMTPWSGTSGPPCHGKVVGALMHYKGTISPGSLAVHKSGYHFAATGGSGVVASRAPLALTPF